MGVYHGNPYRAFVVDISWSYIILVWDNTHKSHSAQILQDLLNGTKYFWTYFELSHMLRGEFFELQQIVAGVKRSISFPVTSCAGIYPYRYPIPPISDLVQSLLEKSIDRPTVENPLNCAISEKYPLDNATVYSMSPQLVVVVVAAPIIIVAAAVAAAVPIVFDLLQQRLAERLVDLTEEQLACVTAALLPPHNDALLVEKFGIPVTRSIGSCLNPKRRLNDEIINYYMQMLQEWDKQLCEADPKRKPSHFFNLFFMTKLLQNNKYTYANVKR
jgi:hypothetical protein